MRCPICEALNREHGRECEVEAAAILRQDSGGPQQDQHVEVLISTRKKQMKITSRLDAHMAKAHHA